MTLESQVTVADNPKAITRVVSSALVRRRWNDYAVWRQQHSPSVCERWTLTGHKLKAQSDKDAQSRLRRLFNGCGFTHMSLIAMPVGETPNRAIEPNQKSD